MSFGIGKGRITGKKSEDLHKFKEKMQQLPAPASKKISDILT